MQAWSVQVLVGSLNRCKRLQLAVTNLLNQRGYLVSSGKDFLSVEFYMYSAEALIASQTDDFLRYPTKNYTLAFSCLRSGTLLPSACPV